MSREEWKAKDISTGRRLISENVIYVLLHHTSTNNCYSLSDCTVFMRNYQVKIQFLLS